MAMPRLSCITRAFMEGSEVIGDTINDYTYYYIKKSL
jgi:hypothetical protein